MDDVLMKRLFYFSVAVLLSIVLVWFGIKLLFVTNYTFSSTLLFVVGLLLFLCLIYVAGVVGFGQFWWINAIVILTALYCFARAAGIFATPWLAHLMGLGAWLAAATLLFLTWPSRPNRLIDSNDIGPKDDE